MKGCTCRVPWAALPHEPTCPRAAVVQVVGAGQWAQDAADRLAALGHAVVRVTEYDHSGRTWVFLEGDRHPHAFVWLIDGTQNGAAAASRWHSVYGEDGPP